MVTGSQVPDEESIFHTARGISDPDVRREYVHRTCGNRADLRVRVEALLVIHENDPEFLQSPAIALPPDPGQLPEMAGTQIGRYKLLEQIGEGGFAVVFMAQGPGPAAERVALKIIKPGMDSKQVVARFEAERQALALMDHPNIARVLDAGTTDSGHPFFVMELVRGIPITDYCQQSRGALSQRLKLFVSVCHAVQHAHQKGIIHRDIKPSNVLVTLHDGRPVAKIIDFGIAKALLQRLTERTIFTGFRQMIGTPLYMSPEQAEWSGLDVDTRSDVYSLGVLLYEILTGTTPIDESRCHALPISEICRLIRDEDPPSPSARISTLSLTGPTVSEKAEIGVRPAIIDRLPGELDWIVMKALEKDRARRYESASALAADVMRFLSNEPVEACPPSMLYRLGKFARRNRTAVVAAGVVACALVAGTAVSSWQAVRAGRAERIAEQRLEAERTALLETEAARARADAASRDAAQQRDRALVAESQAQANLLEARRAVDEYFTLVSQNPLLDVPELQPLRRQLLEAALRYHQEFVQQQPENPLLQADLARSYFRAAQIHNVLNANDQSIAALASGIEIVEKLLSDHPRDRSLFRRLAGVFQVSPGLHHGTAMPADPAAALRSLQKATILWQQLADQEPGLPAFRNDLAGFHCLVGDMELAFGRQQEALEAYQQSRAIWAALYEQYPDVPEYRLHLARSEDVLGIALRRVGRATDAQQSLRHAMDLRRGLASDHPENPQFQFELARSCGQIAELLGDAGRIDQATALLAEAEQLLASLVHRFPRVPAFQENVGANLRQQAALHLQMDNVDKAESAYRRALAIDEELAAELPSLPQYREHRAETAQRLCMVLIKQGRWDEAEALYETVLEAMEQVAADAPQQPNYRRRLAGAYHTAGDFLHKANKLEKAEKAYRRAIEIEQQLIDALPDVPMHHRELARLLALCPIVSLRDPQRALELATSGVEMAPDDAASWYTLGAVHLAAERWREARDALEKSLAILPSGRGETFFYLAMAHWHLGDRQQAEKSFNNGVKWTETFKPQDQELSQLRARVESLMQGEKPSEPS